MKNLTENKMESKLYTYLQLPDDYWTSTHNVEYVEG